MTSVLRKYAQIDARVRFFTTLTDISGIVLSVTSPIMSVTQFALADISEVFVPVASVLKDMGSSITVYDNTQPGSPHVAVYRRVQLVNGPDTEGVGGSPPDYQTFYVLTWSADGLGVGVARTG